MENENNDPLAQLEAMKKIADALASPNAEARNHVLDWASKNFGLPGGNRKIAASQTEFQPPDQTKPPGESAKRFNSIAEFYAAANPQSEPEKAAVASYWFQVYEAHPDLDSQRVNTELKHLGHSISNITAAFSALMNRKPQYVIQTRKSGTTQQAQKRYMLTSEGGNLLKGCLRRLLKGSRTFFLV